MQLRPYQIEAIEAAERYWEENPLKNCAIALPTGAGKSVVMAEMARRAVERGERVVIIVHRQELVEQTVEKLRAADPLLMIGIVKAQLNQVSAEVVVASVQTLARPGRCEKLGERGLVIFDEAHISASDSAIGVMTRLGTIGGEVKACAFSATMFRSDGRPLDVIWDDIVYERDILWAVSQGYLSDARGLSLPIRGLDLDSVKMTGGDYQDRDLGQKMMDAHAARQIAQAYAEHASDRIAICFSPTIDAALAISEELNGMGIAAETVIGKTAKPERDRIYSALRSGEIRVLSSVSVLLEGFDVPRVDCVIMARPTKSVGLYIQAVGRGLRLYPGKKDCLILDVAGTHDEHSLVGMSQLAGREKKAPDESLKDMAGDAPESGPRGLRANLRSVGEFDPFARRRMPWYTTPGGTEYIPVKGGDFVFLKGAGDAVRVGLVSGRSTPGNRSGKWLQETPVHGEFAKPLAEAFAEEIGVFATPSEIRKRVGRPASVAQIGYASSLGIDTEGKDSAALMREIDQARARAVLD